MIHTGQVTIEYIEVNLTNVRSKVKREFNRIENKSEEELAKEKEDITKEDVYLIAKQVVRVYFSQKESDEVKGYDTLEEDLRYLIQ